MRKQRLTWLVVLGFACVCASFAPTSAAVTASFKVVDLGNGMTLHYAEAGSGPPLIFVHGSLSDYDYWKPEVSYFAARRRAIAYSRRYNYPNTNPEQPGYSAVVDADDLAAFITKLGLVKVDIVGHSYGALTALFLAERHPELVNSLVLAEPPAVSLLQHLDGDESARGRAMFDDINRNLVAPMQTAFRGGNREAGVATFIDYVLGDPQAWTTKFSAEDRADTMRDAHEWDVMMKTGTLFPEMSPDAVRNITVPVLILDGARSYPFIRLIDAELARLLPDNRDYLLSRSGHQMFYQQQADSQGAVEAFLGVHGLK